MPDKLRGGFGTPKGSGFERHQPRQHGDEGDDFGEDANAAAGGRFPVSLASGQSGPAGIAVDATDVYWTNMKGGTVMKMPLGGGSPITFVSGQNVPSDIRVGRTFVCWTNKDAVMCAGK